LLYAKQGECEKATPPFHESLDMALQLSDYEKAINIYSDKNLRCTFMQG